MIPGFHWDGALLVFPEAHSAGVPYAAIDMTLASTRRVPEIWRRGGTPKYTHRYVQEPDLAHLPTAERRRVIEALVLLEWGAT